MPSTRANVTATVGGNSFFAGKNAIINGDFRINQRGFSSSTTGGFGFDRWQVGANDGTTTYSAQTFTAGAAPVSGYEAINYARMASTGQTSANAYSILLQKIEDVRTFAGQTVTVSFWAKATSGTPSVAINLYQDFGSGGSAGVYSYPSVKKVATNTSWTRYSATISVASVSGKTIGTGSNLTLYLWISGGSNWNTQTDSMGIQTTTIDFWGVQVESGSVATAFQTATGTLQGEIALAQRYFRRYIDKTLYEGLTVGFAQSTTRMIGVLNYAMRTAPSLTVSAAGDFNAETGSSGWKTVTATGLYDATARSTSIYFDVASGLTTGQAGRMAAGNTNATLDLSAEL